MLKDETLINERREILTRLGFDMTRVRGDHLPPTQTSVSILVVLEVFGFTQAQVRRMLKRNFAFLTCAPDRLMNALLNLHINGFSTADIRRIGYAQPRILTQAIERTNETIRSLVNYGFQPDEVAHVATISDSVLYDPIEKTLGRLAVFERCGFPRAETIKACATAPSILREEPERPTQVVETFARRGHGIDDVRAVVKKYASVLRFRPSYIEEHLDVYQYVGILPAKRPNVMGFSPKTLRGRVVYLESIGKTKWPNSLYESSPIFLKRLKVTRDQMIALDPGPEAFRQRLGAEKSA